MLQNVLAFITFPAADTPDILHKHASQRDKTQFLESNHLQMLIVFNVTRENPGLLCQSSFYGKLHKRSLAVLLLFGCKKSPSRLGPPLMLHEVNFKPEQIKTLLDTYSN